LILNSDDKKGGNMRLPLFEDAVKELQRLDKLATYILPVPEQP
jgi:hypothetical protein